MPANPFESPALASRYERWYLTAGRRADRLEKRLLTRLLEELGDPRSVVEIGCGTGHFSRWLATREITVTALDLSLPMLHEAQRLGTSRLAAGYGDRLPLADRSCDVALLVTVLEFVADIDAVVREAARVTRTGLLIGALNRRSLLGRKLTRRGAEPWTSARLPTVGELRDALLRAAADRRPEVRWRTTLWPAIDRSMPLPWGGFIGLVARWTRS